MLTWVEDGPLVVLEFCIQTVPIDKGFNQGFILSLTLFWLDCSDLEQNHAVNKGKTAVGYQFDTHMTRIGLKCLWIYLFTKKQAWFQFPYTNPWIWQSM